MDRILPEKNEIMDMEPEQLNNILYERCVFDVPLDLETIEDMTFAGNLMGKLTNMYSYLSQQLNYLKIATKMVKGKDKNMHEQMMIRRDVVDAFVDVVKQQYNYVSRLITVKQMKNFELKMTDGK